MTKFKIFNFILKFRTLPLDYFNFINTKKYNILKKQ